MSRLVITPTIQSNAFEQFCFLLEPINQQSRHTLSTRCIADAKMHDTRPSAPNSEEKIAETITVRFQGNNYSTKFCVFFKCALWEKPQRLCIKAMQQHDAFKVRRRKTKAFKCDWVAHF
jgi:hypothetical protein